MHPTPVLAAVAALAASVMAAGCGAGAQHVAVGVTTTTGLTTTTASTTTASTTTVPATTPNPSATTVPPSTANPSATTVPPSTANPSATTVPAPTPAPSTGSGADGGGCAAAVLRVGQVPLTGGTGHFYEAWSLTNAGSATCTLAAGQPAVSIDDASDAAVSAFVVTHLSTAPSRPVRLAPSAKAWFLTEESTTACGTGSTVGDGPFHYVVALPGGPTVSWASSDLDGATLADFCAGEGLAVGDLQSTRPGTPT